MMKMAATAAVQLMRIISVRNDDMVFTSFSGSALRNVP